MLKVLLLLPGLLCAAPEWSVWRGPASEGNYDHETTWKHNWLPTGPKTLWQTKVHTGYSGIAVSEGRAYTIGNSEGEDLIQCLNIDTGKIIWNEKYPQDLVPKYNPGGPNAPPIIEGKWLYTLSKQGLVSCLDKATGSTKWRNELATTAQAPMPTWGAGARPEVFRERVLLTRHHSGVPIAQ